LTHFQAFECVILSGVNAHIPASAGMSVFNNQKGDTELLSS